MQVVQFTEIVGRDREEDIETSRRHRRTFQAFTDTANGGADRVLSYVDVPAVGDILTYTETDVPTGLPVFVSDPTLVVVRRRAEQTDANDLTNWTVTVEYMGTDQPETMPAEVEFSPTRYQEHVIDDVNDVKVVNSAGDPFAEGLMRDRTRYTLQIQKNIVDAAWDPIAAESFNDSLNLNPFLVGYYPANPAGFPAGSCKLTLTAKRVKKIGLTEFYWTRTATIDIDTKGWNANVRDAGFRYLDTVANAKRPVLDSATGHPASSPALLDGDGAVLPVGGVPQVIVFVLYVTKDWAPLALEY